MTEMTEMDKARITEKVYKLSPKPGDILHVTVGTEDIGDGQGPWIPDPDTLQQVAQEWDAAVPDGIRVIVTHWAEEAEVEHATG